MENKELEIAKKICRKIENLGYEALLVGGCVRDILLDLEPADIDIATNFPINELEKHFKTFNVGRSKNFGIVIVVKDSLSFEVAQFRNDCGNYTDGRRPDSIEFIPSFEQDAKRRDFTINALAMKPNGKILDFVGGQKDLKNKMLITVGDPKARFTEDKLRILRLARFAAKLDFRIDKQTKKVARQMAKSIKVLAVERITDELKKATKLGGIKFAKYITILDEIKVLQEILPEVAALKFKPETHGHHPEGNTTFKHTIKALESADNVFGIELLAILFHDVGKTITHEIKNGKHTYYGHDLAGVPLIKELGQRMKFSSKEIEMFVFTTKNHMKYHKIPEMKRSKIVKLAQHENFQELITVCLADSLGDTRHIRNTGVLEAVEKAMTIHGNSQPNSLVSGNLIMKLLNLKPGKEVGRIKRLVTEHILNNNLTDETEIEQIILKLGGE